MYNKVYQLKEDIYETQTILQKTTVRKINYC